MPMQPLVAPIAGCTPDPSQNAAAQNQGFDEEPTIESKVVPGTYAAHAFEEEKKMDDDNDVIDVVDW